MYFYVYRDQSVHRDIRWTLYAANSRKIANAGEGYRNKEDAVHAINLFAREGIEIRYEAGL